MTKRDKITRIHKVLFAKEDFDDATKPECTLEVFRKCVSNCMIRMSGVDMDKKLKDNVVETLDGILKLSDTITHDEVRSAILGLMNDIDRSE